MKKRYQTPCMDIIPISVDIIAASLIDDVTDEWVTDIGGISEGQ